jgi:hypothetical protein
VNTEDFVSEFLKDQGFSVRKIETSDRKSPDFLVRDSSHTYLLEVKTKYEDTQKAASDRALMERGGIAVGRETMGRKNSVSTVVREAGRQLSEGDEEADFRVVWLQAGGRHPSVQFDQLSNTLYGSVDMLDRLSDAPMSPCYYFTHSEFFRLKDQLDGAVVTDGERVKFCLNAFSERYEALKESKLCRTFDPGIEDPVAREAAGEAYIADCDFDRGTKEGKAAVLAWVRKKYKNDTLQDMVFEHHTATMMVPKK